MIAFILLVVFVAMFMKLREMNDRMTIMMGKIDSLQHSLNGKSAQESLSQPLEKEAPKVMKIESSEKPLSPHQPLPKRPKQEKILSSGLEDFLVGNVLLNISVVAFVLGIGFFLKYSIDRDWIPIEARMFIGIAVAIGMIFAAVKIGAKRPKLFREVLFGGAIAILYLSVYAGFALEGFAFLSSGMAFVMMVAITVLAGMISLRFDSLTTAVFGLVGGFLTPYLMHGMADVKALMVYILVLNAGVLYIAFSKRYSLLNILAFALSMVIEFQVSEKVESFYFLMGIYFVLFVIYSIVPFIHQIRAKNIKLETALTVLFGANILLYLLVSAKLFVAQGYAFKYFSIVTIVVGLYLFYYAFRLKKVGEFTSNLYSLVVAKGLGILLLTPAIMLDGGRALSAVWAVEATILLFISHKSEEKNHLYFAILGFALAFARYLGVDLVEVYMGLDSANYSARLMKEIFTALIMIGAFTYASSLPIAKNMQEKADEWHLKKALILGAGVMLFLFLNVEVLNWSKLFLPEAKDIAVTLLWVLFGIGGFFFALKKEIVEGKNIAIGLIMIAVLKAFFLDLAQADSLYRIILFIVVGILLFVLAYQYKRGEDAK